MHRWVKALAEASYVWAEDEAVERALELLEKGSNLEGGGRQSSFASGCCGRRGWRRLRHSRRTFGADRDRSPLASQVVIEVTHATYGLHDEPIEAVISVRPASSNVLVFETYEGDPAADQDDQLATQPRPLSPPAAREPR